MRRVCRIGVSAILCLWQTTQAQALWPGWPTEMIDSHGTAQGLLQIFQVGMDGYGIVLNGHVLRELEAYSAHVKTTFPPGDEAAYVLLKIESGGGSCPEKYRLLDVTPGRKPQLTAEFGNCSAEPALHMQGEDLLIDFPAWSGARAQTWVYQTGPGRLVPCDNCLSQDL